MVNTDMKKYLLVFIIFTSHYALAQSFYGNWYLMDKTDLWEFEIQKDTLRMYPHTPSDLSKHNTPEMAGAVMAFKEKVIKDTVMSCRYISVSNGHESGSITLSLSKSGKKSRLYLSAIPDKGNENIITPVRLITAEEIKLYATLPDLSEMTDADFITFANKVTALTTRYKQHTDTMSKIYLFSELKFIIADLGYNPFISPEDIETKLKKFETRPATSRIAKSYQH